MKFALLLAPLAALVTSPALAADPAQLNCPLEGMSAQQRDAVAETFIRMGAGGDAGAAPLRERVQACAARFRWSEAASNNAVGYHGATLALAVLRQRLTATGADVAALERVIRGDSQLINAFGPDGIADGAMNAFVMRNEAFITQMLASLSDDDQTLAGNLTGFIVASEGLRRQFAQN